MHPLDHMYQRFVQLFEEGEQRSKASFKPDIEKHIKQKPKTARAKSLNNALEKVEIIDVHPEKT